jgi:hypothetical protein
MRRRDPDLHRPQAEGLVERESERENFELYIYLGFLHVAVCIEGML